MGIEEPQMRRVNLKGNSISTITSESSTFVRGQEAELEIGHRGLSRAGEC